MINVSFYLLTPDAKSKTLVYVSITNKGKRIRFSSRHTFISNYCNIRKKKGVKELVKRNTPFYLEYNNILKNLRDELLRIEFELSKEKKDSLENIRDKYLVQNGYLKDESKLTFHEAFDNFITYSKSSWGESTHLSILNLQNHIKEFEKLYGIINLDDITDELWKNLRDNYFVNIKSFSNNTTNKNLKKFKQFLKYIIKKQLTNVKIDLTELKYLEEIEPYKIALKEKEIEDLISLDFSKMPVYENVRALFLLEVLTGQRYSDLANVLDSTHVSEESIQFYQQKTGVKITIPLYKELKNHLAQILKNNPNGISIISNVEFNKTIKLICKMAGMDREHSWITQSGLTKTKHTDFRYNLVSTHTGRRTFCTISLKQGISPEHIMKVTGHKKYDQFKEYVKVDDEDLSVAFEGFMDNRKK